MKKAAIQFLNGIDEKVIPEIRLTKSKDGQSGQAFFRFDRPDALLSDNFKNIQGMYLIDEEGQMVSRLANTLNHNINANFFGKLYEIDKNIGSQIYKTYIKVLCSKLKKIGINVNTIPVLDILRKNTHSIIGERSFSKKKDIVKQLGKITVKECHAQKIITVIKHIPGHGCSSKDSHITLPKVSLKVIIKHKKINNVL